MGSEWVFQRDGASRLTNGKTHSDPIFARAPFDVMRAILEAGCRQERLAPRPAHAVAAKAAAPEIGNAAMSAFAPSVTSSARSHSPANALRRVRVPLFTAGVREIR